MANRTQKVLDKAEYDELSLWLARNGSSSTFEQLRGMFEAFRECGEVADGCRLTYKQYCAYLTSRGAGSGDLPPMNVFDRLRSQMCTRLLQPASYACGWERYPSTVTVDRTDSDITVQLTLTKLWHRVGDAIERTGPPPGVGEPASHWLWEVFQALKGAGSGSKAGSRHRYHPVRTVGVRPAELDKPVLSQGQTAPEEAVGLQLLALIWDYPKQGTQQRSWGVKESSVLRGELEHAREHPGLGVSIATTQLAQACFGAAASASRIDGCVDWASAILQKQRPYLLLAESHDQILGRYVKTPDFRHTLAFAVILARTGREPEYVAHYRRTTLRRQRKDGGWPPGEGATTNELFSAIYAVELLNLCAIQDGQTARSRRTTERARDKGRVWIEKQPRWKGLWQSGVFKDEGDLFDALFATSWVIRRSTPSLDGGTSRWTRCLEDGVAHVVDAVSSAAGRRLCGKDELQRFRIEVRVASAAAVAARTLNMGEINQKRVARYLSGWRTRAFNVLRRLPLRELDVATAVFLIDSLVNPRNLVTYAHRVRQDQGD